MTVEQLIEKLKELPPKTKVYGWDSNWDKAYELSEEPFIPYDDGIIFS